jgi:purine-binding chemotaxis protein CheW
MSDSKLNQALTQRREINREIVNVDEPTVQLVIVDMGGTWFALQGKHIREILAQADVFYVPGCPSSMEGVINLRGNIESVIRLHGILQLPYPSTTVGSHVLLAQSNSINTGIRVEQVIDLIDVVESSLQAPPSTLPAHLATVVSHIVHFQQQPIAVLDLAQLLSRYADGLG